NAGNQPAADLAREIAAAAGNEPFALTFTRNADIYDVNRSLNEGTAARMAEVSEAIEANMQATAAMAVDQSLRQTQARLDAMSAQAMASAQASAQARFDAASSKQRAKLAVQIAHLEAQQQARERAQEIQRSKDAFAKAKAGLI